MADLVKRKRCSQALALCEQVETVKFREGDRVRLCSNPALSGCVVRVSRGWRRVSFDDGHEASHRTSELAIGSPALCLPIGTWVHLRNDPTKIGIVIAIIRGGWRRVALQGGSEIAKRPTELEKTMRPLRRLRCKQPLEMPLVISIQGDQRAEAKLRKHDGQLATHYATLGVTPSALPECVRVAYRRCALAAHPDKGGSCEAFNAIQAAYEILGDPVRRAAYDAQCGIVQQEPEATRSSATSQEINSVLILARLQELSVREWLPRLQELTPKSLQELAMILATGGQQNFRRPGRGRKTDKIKGILKDGMGYYAKLSWRGINVYTVPTPSLEQAIDWHATLVMLRGQASSAMEHGSSFEEAAAVFETSQAWWFELDRMVSGVRYITPCVLDLRKLLQMNVELLSAASGRGTIKTRKTSVQNVRKRFLKQFAGFRTTSQERRSILFKIVELEARGTQPSRLKRLLGA
eukprot:CAMPEP_0169129158 /NCGR_PEP_ID=MMETSP1015-20121227/36972_1 /TAXON_ID=342587 /ORGANISM="Karlodinium micrum, Strain CCMP2283" /LENGTH=464 /DNA_ID=CAMNT_0009193149 /DNA_START=59 /DNA_END=1453 /DNA_ORIENTATION=+